MTRIKYWWHWSRFRWFYFWQGLALRFGNHLMGKIEVEKAGVEANRWYA